MPACSPITSPVGRHQLAGGIGQSVALLGQIGVNKILVIAAGDKANFL